MARTKQMTMRREPTGDVAIHKNVSGKGAGSKGAKSPMISTRPALQKMLASTAAGAIKKRPHRFRPGERASASPKV